MKSFLALSILAVVSLQVNAISQFSENRLAEMRVRHNKYKHLGVSALYGAKPAPAGPPKPHSNMNDNPFEPATGENTIEVGGYVLNVED